MSETAAVPATLRMMDSSMGRTPGRSVITSTVASGACRRVERSFTRAPTRASSAKYAVCSSACLREAATLSRPTAYTSSAPARAAMTGVTRR